VGGERSKQVGYDWDLEEDGQDHYPPHNEQRKLNSGTNYPERWYGDSQSE